MLGLEKWTRRLFGGAAARNLRRYRAWVEEINALEEEIAKKTPEDMKARMKELADQAQKTRPLDEMLAESFAIAREAAKRALGQRPFDEQLMGGMILHEGRIAEMKTGEGKTLAATLPICLNALAGQGAHIVTVNDYLAKRDSEWMGGIYRYVGLETGRILHGMDDEERRQAYAADVTYGTNNEFGFDYLRDNMKYRREEMVQRGHAFAIVDEVDSILIDEARTPLIISGPVEDKSELYAAVSQIIPLLSEKDYEKDEKHRSVTLTEEGQETVENLLRQRSLLEGSLYGVENVSLVHHVNQALRAHCLFQRDRDYILRGGKLVIVDEFTGRMMEGRRYSEGLHQALEAKEGVKIEPENQTLASITFQNYFRLYDKLAGMTGTALTEADEFMEIYGLDVAEVPTHLPICRDDMDDEIYRTAEEKAKAIVETIAECQKRGQPVLVGTVSIEKSEHFSSLLKKRGIPHQVLNARYHEQEAQIIAQAGKAGAVTIATNMAGRGTDIQLGGNLDMALAEKKAGNRKDKIEAEHKKDKAQTLKEGGLFILGTERHEARRIDNQLRGRSGRQGDPGASKFFLSLQDDLMRIFGTERMGAMLQKLGLRDDEAIEHPWVSKALEKAQSRVEGHNFDIRKNLLKYDNVMNDQRHVIFAQRLELIEGENLAETANDMREQIIEEMVEAHIPPRSYPEEWNLEGLSEQASRTLGLNLPLQDWADEEGIAEEEITARLKKEAADHMRRKASFCGDDVMREIEKAVLLQTLDQHWREHLLRLEHLRQVVGLRGYGQRDPLNEYKTEAFSLFEAMLAEIREDVTRHLMTLEIRRGDEPPPLSAPAPVPAMELRHDPAESLAPQSAPLPALPPNAATRQDAAPAPPRQDAPPPPRRSRSQGWGKVGRNDPCPCGSGKKYKRCHGA